MASDVELVVVDPDRLGDPERRAREPLAQARHAAEPPLHVAAQIADPDPLGPEVFAQHQHLARVSADRSLLEPEDARVLMGKSLERHGQSPSSSLARATAGGVPGEISPKAIAGKMRTDIRPAATRPAAIAGVILSSSTPI